MKQTQTATPKKLNDGTWGARVSGAVAVGDEITITTRSGKSWTARVDRVLWSGDDVTLVSTSSSRRATSPRPISDAGISGAGTPANVTRSDRCSTWGCGGAVVENGYCAQCAHDEV